tara:strand:+ start:4802 stop:5101 length:300 start_codon:yes stop_codon:yes gene_type:complete
MYHFGMISFRKTKEEQINLTEDEARDIACRYLRKKFFPELTMVDIWTEVYIESDEIREAGIHPHKQERLSAKTKRVLTKKEKFIWSLIEDLERKYSDRS